MKSLPFLLLLPLAFVSGYALGLWADSWERRQRNKRLREILDSWTINDVKKIIEERNSVSEYDSESTTRPNQN